MKSDLSSHTNRLAQSYAQACASPAGQNLSKTHGFAAAAKRDYSENVPDADPLGAPMTIREVASLLGCSPWTVRQRHLRNGLPFFRIGTTGKLLFYRNQVVHWILQSQKERG
jgi:excisionase family DNA binding protein